MTERTEDFYDRLAGDYHLIFDDWERAVVRQGKILDSLLRQRGLPVPARIFDCACGIGTQALGLAGRGHVVAGSDASVAAITRARAEAAKRGLDVAFTVADMRTLAGLERAAFDAVVCADNALPHLMSAAELRATTGAIAACLKPGGLFLGSIRDYDAALLQRPTAVPPRFLDKGGPHRIIHQIWEWLDEERYRLHLYITLETASGWACRHYVSLYRALSRAALTSALAAAGLAEIAWLMPNESGYYQPIVLARKARADQAV
ncbi:MAG TPA: class I SAM-dependent methyltransferase [Alphaproteobacteria bacterium]|nr:class I SAM-dependent methyltransferase [Alphaproteobacteria bacterium]